MNTISNFHGLFRWLSNFHPVSVSLDGETYSSVEAAYQAAKSTDPHYRQLLASTTSAPIAKRLGRSASLRPDWEQVKEPIMLDLLRQKFSGFVLRTALLNTGEAELVEGNYWHDNYWGSCTCNRCGDKGRNRLGMLLMQVRSELAREDLDHD